MHYVMREKCAYLEALRKSDCINNVTLAVIATSSVYKHCTEQWPYTILYPLYPCRWRHVKESPCFQECLSTIPACFWAILIGWGTHHKEDKELFVKIITQWIASTIWLVMGLLNQDFGLSDADESCCHLRHDNIRPCSILQCLAGLGGTSVIECKFCSNHGQWT